MDQVPWMTSILDTMGLLIYRILRLPRVPTAIFSLHMNASENIKDLRCQYRFIQAR
jgi:hypothetical protein